MEGRTPLLILIYNSSSESSKISSSGKSPHSTFLGRVKIPYLYEETRRTEKRGDEGRREN
jgi:hypothetical protein